MIESDFSKFNSPSYGSLSFEEVIDKLFEYAGNEPGMDYELIVGTDSVLYGDASAEFVSAIVVHRKSRGGIYFWCKTNQAHLHTLRDRIFQEALLSLRLAEKLVETLRAKEIQDFNLSIHVDVGPNGETKKLINEVVGMIKGNGFDVKTKPESYGASSVADRHT